MNFLITNMSGFRNKGCEASTKAVVNEITKLDENARFKIFTEDVEYDAFWTRRNENISFLTNPFRREYFLDGLSFLPRWWQYRLIGKLSLSSLISRSMNSFHEVDAVLSTGGDIFGSTYGDLANHLVPLRIAASFGKPIFLVGHSIGPFENQSEKKAFAKLAKDIQLITVRESLSLKYLQDMELESARIELTADPAFCLEPEMENIEKIFRIYNIPKDKLLIGVAPSQGISYYSRMRYEHHLDTLRKLLQFLIENLECHVVLIPHVQLASIAFDDSIICELLYRKLDFPENVSVINLTHSAEEIRALTSTFDLMIAERMHAAISSLSQNVPTFVIGYSVKAEGILGDIFGFSSLDDYVITVKEMETKKLIERVKSLLERKSEVTKILGKVMPKIKRRAERNFTLVMEALG